MKFTFIIIAILQLSILGCKYSSPVSKVPPDQISVSTSIASEPPKATEVGTVKLNPIEYYTTSQERAILTQVEKKLNEVKSSKCTHDFLAARKMIQTQNKTSLQVANHVASLSGSVDVVMYYSRFSSAMAYRQPPELKINLNRKYFYATLAICEWVSTVLHESLHALANYEHDYQWNAQRDFSVAYSANAAVEKCCNE